MAGSTGKSVDIAAVRVVQCKKASLCHFLPLKTIVMTGKSMDKEDRQGVN